MRSIPEELILERLRTENPWWESPAEIPPHLQRLTPRAYLDLFFPLVAERQVRRAVVLMGPRRVGKTVLLHHVIAKLLDRGISPTQLFYVSVDHPLYTNLDLDRFFSLYGKASGVDLKRQECYVFFDEIQYLKDWELYLKAIVDRFPNIRCIASGSAAAALKLKSQESGAGRFSDFLLPPLTFHEFLLLRGRDELVIMDRETRSLPQGSPDLPELNRLFVEYLNHGGYPEALFSPEIRDDPERYIKRDIIDKVLLRDLPGLYGIQDIQELNYLFTTLAFNTANEVSLDQLSSNSGVAKNTIKKYIEYLEAAFLVRIVHRVDKSAKRFQRANFFKVYLSNPSMRSALFSPIGPEDSAMGPLVETALFSQWFHRQIPLHYARWKEGEVDLVKLQPDQRIEWALEAKWSDRFFDRPGDVKALLGFCKKNGLNSAWVTSRTSMGTREVQGVELRFMPASLYCCTKPLRGSLPAKNLAK